MAGSSEISEFLGKRGLDLRADDIDELRAMLASLPPEQYDEVAPGVWESVAQVINDPAYEGDAEMPDSD